MRIGLNLLHALPEIGGGWNYMSNMLDLLGRTDSQNEYVAFVTPASEALVPRRPNFRVVITGVRAQVRVQRIAYENTVLQMEIWRERPDCVHWFANSQGIVNVAPAVVTVYDLQPFLRFAPFSPAKRAFLQWRLRSTVKHGAMLLPMSQATADGLRCVLRADPLRMVVVPPVLEGHFRPASQDEIERCRSRYRLPARFWLYVAHMYPHKNHARLLQAYAVMKTQDAPPWPLVLRGDPRWGSNSIKGLVEQLGLTNDVIFLPGLPRQELPALYGAAAALIFPSLYEGAGMPVLEAQACGCPVIAADIPAVREFAGDAARHFNPLDVGDISRAMSAFACDSSADGEMRTRGLENARSFRETRVVERLLAAYRHASRNTSQIRPRSVE